MHGTWRKVEETTTAIQLIGRVLQSLAASQATWFLDSPVSNSGRLKQLIEAVGAQHSWEWKIELVPNPDPVLIAASEIVATADSVILDGCRRWCALAERAVRAHVPNAWLLELGET